MLSLEAVQKALKAHVSLSNLNFAWPNQKFDGVPPYIDVEVVFSGSENTTISGSDHHDLGFVVMVAVIDSDVSTEEAFRMFDTIRSLVRKGTRIAVGNGHVLFSSEVEIIASGYQTDSDWRLPFQVNFQTS